MEGVSLLEHHAIPARHGEQQPFTSGELGKMGEVMFSEGALAAAQRPRSQRYRP
jgi:hypothetical protein